MRFFLSAIAALALCLPASAEEPGFAPEAGQLELGFYGGVWLPPSDHELYAISGSTQKPLQDLNLTLGLRAGWYPLSFLGLEAEGGLMPTGLRSPAEGSALALHLRVQAVLQVPYEFAPFLCFGYGNYFIRSNPEVLGDDQDVTLHLGLGAKAYLTELLALRLDLRWLISAQEEPNPLDNNGVTSHFEILAGLSFVLGRSERVAPAPSPTPEPSLAAPPPPADADQDGVLDAQDRCPDEAGPPPDGCPDPDPDHDGVLGNNDQCPTEAGVAPHGCPDTDGDGIRDSVDQCPDQAETKNGYKDADGCPDELPAEVKRFSGAIPGINFLSGSAIIQPSSFPLLDKAAEVLKEYAMVRLEIGGHTDNQGPAELNRRLSSERAEAVRSYLEAKGVDPERLSAKGYGPDQPIADNRTAAGRSKNRRIEFKLVE
ncbi:MAG: OmpA family protein [Myxococcota bacterium]